MGRNSLAREITFALVFKVAVLTALFVLFFGPSHRKQVTATEMAKIYSSADPLPR